MKVWYYLTKVNLESKLISTVLQSKGEKAVVEVLHDRRHEERDDEQKGRKHLI